MPIYAYRCTTCDHAQDVLRKMSDPPLEVCPACGATTFVKQVTAAGFQLKGSGWYATDFRGDKKPAQPAEGDAAAPTEGKPAEDGAATPEAKEAPKGDATAENPETAAASAPPAAPAPPPATPPANPGRE